MYKPTTVLILKDFNDSVLVTVMTQREKKKAQSEHTLPPGGHEDEQFRTGVGKVNKYILWQNFKMFIFLK